MSAARRFLLRLASFFRTDRAEADLAREVNSHLQLLEDNFISQGMSPQDARPKGVMRSSCRAWCTLIKF